MKGNCLEVQPTSPNRQAIRSFLFRGGSFLALATLIERGLLFFANTSAARIAGPENYGTYGLALQTASFMATQAGMGIGLVATRFSSEYPMGHAHHRDFIQKIIHLSLILAAGSSLLMLALAWPMAHWFYQKPMFFRVLIVGIISTPAFVLLDAIRGMMLGLSYHRGIAFLSLFFGLGMLVLMPWAAGRSARWMILTHAICALTACGAIFLILRQKFELTVLRRPTHHVPLRPMLRFGLFQLGSTTAMNLCMMALMAMLVRFATKEELLITSLLPLGLLFQHGVAWMMNMGLSVFPLFGFHEVGYYNAANSVRNVTSIVPGLLNQTTIGLMTKLKGEEFGGVNRILLINTWLTAMFMIPTTVALLLLLPFLIPLLFGYDFTEAVTPAGLLLAVALVHMVSQAAVNRLTVVSPRTVMVIILIWIVITLLGGWFLIPAYGATGVAIALVISHTASALMVLAGLSLHECMPQQLPLLTLLSIAVAGLYLAILNTSIPLWHWQRCLPLLLVGCLLAYLGSLFQLIRKDQ
ncbi:MAG: oligosaccharide flippase family protein [Gemmatales bacterium]